MTSGEISITGFATAVGLTRNGVGLHLEALCAAGFVTNRHATHPRGSGLITYVSAAEDAIWDALIDLEEALGLRRTA